MFRLSSRLVSPPPKVPHGVCRYTISDCISALAGERAGVNGLFFTEIDGVRVVWAEVPAPLRAGLLFRTGLADESLPTLGQTHLIEHIALSAVGELDGSQNGFVSGAVTGFSKVGTPEDVAQFLTGLCTALSELPGDRLEAEKQVLSAEAAAGGYEPVGKMLTKRYGVHGYGMLGVREFGLQPATVDSLRAKAAHSFTRENAVLWLTGEPPSGLRLPLPAGVRVPIAPPRGLRSFPCWYVDDASGGVAASMAVPRTSAGTVLRQIAAKRLSDRLRTDLALSYAPGIGYDPLDANVAHLVLYADSQPEQREALAAAFGELFGQLGEIDESEVAAAKQEIIDHMTGPLAPPYEQILESSIQQAAMDDLYGRRFEPLQYLAERLMAVEPDHVRSYVEEARKRALFAVPGVAQIEPWMGEWAEAGVTELVSGKASRSLLPGHAEQLVIGSAGASLVWPDGFHRSVRYEYLAGALTWQDGGICLIGTDGTEVEVEPSLWRRGDELRQDVLDRVPEHLLVDDGERPQESIPSPPPLRARLVASGKVALGWVSTVLGVLMGATAFGIALDAQAGIYASRGVTVLSVAAVLSILAGSNLVNGRGLWGRPSPSSWARELLPRNQVWAALAVAVAAAVLLASTSHTSAGPAPNSIDELLATAPADGGRTWTFVHVQNVDAGHPPSLTAVSVAGRSGFYRIALLPDYLYGIDSHDVGYDDFLSAARADKSVDCQVVFSRRGVLGCNLLVTQKQSAFRPAPR